MKDETVAINDSIRIQQVHTAAFKIPTATPESDGTLTWNNTTLIITEIEAAGKTGIGYTYADSSAAYMIEHSLKSLVIGKNIFDIPSITNLLSRQIRNNGCCGVAMMAV